MYIAIITINHTIILYLQARTRSSARPPAAGSPTLCPSVSTRTSSPAGAARAARARALSPCRYLDTNIYTVYLQSTQVDGSGWRGGGHGAALCPDGGVRGGGVQTGAGQRPPARTRPRTALVHTRHRHAHGTSYLYLSS